MQGQWSYHGAFGGRQHSFCAFARHRTFHDAMGAGYLLHISGTPSSRLQRQIPSWSCLSRWQCLLVLFGQSCHILDADAFVMAPRHSPCVGVRPESQYQFVLTWPENSRRQVPIGGGREDDEYVRDRRRGQQPLPFFFWRWPRKRYVPILFKGCTNRLPTAAFVAIDISIRRNRALSPPQLSQQQRASGSLLLL